MSKSPAPVIIFFPLAPLLSPLTPPNFFFFSSFHTLFPHHPQHPSPFASRPPSSRSPANCLHCDKQIQWIELFPLHPRTPHNPLFYSCPTGSIHNPLFLSFVALTTHLLRPTCHLGTALATRPATILNGQLCQYICIPPCLSSVSRLEHPSSYSVLCAPRRMLGPTS